MDQGRQSSELVVRLREALDRHEAGGGTLPALLADLKQLLHQVPDGQAERCQEVLAALRAVGRAWTQGESGDGTVALEVERDLRDALDDLRRAVERLG